MRQNFRVMVALLGLGTATTAMISCGGAGGGGPLGGGGSLGSISYNVIGAAQEPVIGYSNATVVTGIAGAEFTGIQVNDRFLSPLLYVTNEFGVDSAFAMLPTTGVRTKLIDVDFGSSYQRDLQLNDHGSNFTFTSNYESATSRIFIGEVGKKTWTVLPPTSAGANDSQAAWLPDFAGFFFVSDSDGNKEIWYMDGDGNFRTNMTNTGPGIVNESPALSPDGSFVVFVSNRDGNNEIYRMNFNGSGLTRLTNDAGSDENPEFSPNGQKIIWNSNRSGNHDIYTMNAVNGTQVTKLTTDVNADTQPSFSPDGTKIYFSSTRDDTAAPISTEIYSMLSNGSSQTRLPIDSSYSQQGPQIAKSWSYPIENIDDVFTPNSGFLMAQTNTVLTSLVTFDCVSATTANRALTRVVSNIPGGTTVSNLMFTIKTDTGLQRVSVLTFPPNSLKIFPTVDLIYVPGNATNALVTYSAAGTTAGQVVSVVPYAANRSGVNSKVDNGVTTVTGDFSSLFDGKGKNLAPNGVTELKYDAKTGELLSYR